MHGLKYTFSLFISAGYVIGVILGLSVIGNLLNNLLCRQQISQKVNFHFSFLLGTLFCWYVFFITGIFIGINKFCWQIIILILTLAGIIKYAPAFPGLKFAVQRFIKGDLWQENKLEIISLLTLFLFNLLYNFSPVNDLTGLQCHLAIPEKWLMEKMIRFDPFDKYEQFYPTFGAKFFFFLGLLIDPGGKTSKLFVYFFSILSVSGAFLLFRRLVKPKTALRASLLLYSTPALINFSGTCYAELISLYFGILALYAFWRWQNEERKWVFLAALATVATMSCKHIGIMLFVTLTLMGLLAELNSGRLEVKNLFVYSLLVIILFVGYPLRNYIVSGNIFYPYNFLDKPGHPLFIMTVASTVRQVNIFERLQMLGKIIFWGVSPHSPGLNFLPVLLSILFWKKREIRIAWLFYVTFVFINSFFSYLDPKYFVLAFVPLALISAITIENLCQKIPHVVVVLLILPGIAYSFILGCKRLPLYIGTITEREYLERKYPGKEGWSTVEWANKNLLDGNILYVSDDIFDPPEFYYHRQVYFYYRKWLMKDWPAIIAELKKRNIRYVLLIKDQGLPVEEDNWLELQGKKIYSFKSGAIYKLIKD